MRSEVYGMLPKWRQSRARPSCLDLMTLLRQQLREKPALARTLGILSSYEQMTLSAAA